MDDLTDRITYYQNKGYDVRLTDSKHPYIEDVINFQNNIKTPKNI